MKMATLSLDVSVGFSARSTDRSTQQAISPSTRAHITSRGRPAALSSTSHIASRSALSARPSLTKASSTFGPVGVRAAGEVYEAELLKPYGLKFYRGEDGGVYIDAIAPGLEADRTGKFTEGDKVIETSAVFGNEMWPAAEYGRTMYTINQRIGPMLIRMEKRDGVKIGPYKAEKYLEERGAGNVGDAIREKQIQNYLKKVEMEEKRQEELDAGLDLYKEGKFDEALVRFQTVIELLPEYKEQAIAYYNIACCCSKLNQVDAGLQALEAAMEAGFEDYNKIRQDPDLAKLRDSDEFDELLSKYDEPFINENAIKALTSVFGIFGKK